eukprot:SAG31_NODE_2276_length_6028_cov_44.362287_1_plen_78_part_00
MKWRHGGSSTYSNILLFGNDTTYLEMTQPDYIDTMIKQFEEHISKRKFTRKLGEVQTPFPPGVFLSTMGDPEFSKQF